MEHDQILNVPPYSNKMHLLGAWPTPHCTVLCCAVRPLHKPLDNPLSNTPTAIHQFRPPSTGSQALLQVP